MKPHYLILLLSLALLSAGTASAGPIWNLTFTTEGGLDFAGQISTDDYSSTLGGYLVTSVTGTLGTSTIRHPLTLIAPGGFNGNDNLLLSASPWGTESGISFLDTASAANYNLYWNADGQGILSVLRDGDEWDDFIERMDVSLATPEPATLALFAACLALFGWRARRRQDS